MKRAQIASILSILSDQLPCTLHTMQSWDKINEYYNIDEAPLAFVNRMRVKLAAFKMRFEKHERQKLTRIDLGRFYGL